MNISRTDIITARRRLLRDWLSHQGLRSAHAAMRAGYDPVYFRALLNGQYPISDAAAWRLRYRLGVPLDRLEPAINLADL